MVEACIGFPDSRRLQLAIEVGCLRIGLESLKPEQLDAVRLLLQGKSKSVFVTLPTGYGKSAIFHVLHFCASSLLSSLENSCHKPLVLIISPLVSLSETTEYRSYDVKGLQLSLSAGDRKRLVGGIVPVI